ncbi:MAG: carbohydrate kinase family protein [Pyrinomonadaceae bacterium]
MPEKEWDAVVIGDVFTDIILSDFYRLAARTGEESFAKAHKREIGGGAAITACGTARLGLRTALLAVVGGDDDTWLVDKLKLRGVNTDQLQRHPSEPTGLTVSVSTTEDRAFFTYFGANQGLPNLLSESSLRREVMSRARHVHLACAPEPALLIDLTRELRASDVRVSVDVGWHEAWLKSSLSAQALQGVSLFMPNEREAEAMTGETEPPEMLRAFARMGLHGVVLKLGANGAALLLNRQTYMCPAQRVDAVDTTGAGDCFDAGFIYGWSRGEAPETCLRMASICGAFSTRGLGGVTTFPTIMEIMTALEIKGV